MGAHKQEFPMPFRITGLDPQPFRRFYGLSDQALSAHGVRRMTVDKMPGFPERVELRDLEIGEKALLLNYMHQPADTPYRSSHAVFVREGADRPADLTDEVPDVIRRRMISLRAFSWDGDILDADVMDGTEIENTISRFFENSYISYLHAHYARYGCFAARITRD